ncbi:DUF305 domain-containing protein [Microbacterium thalli]|uniref:DUF305 domain-containing protein n=1 Tax=Microbacterium thalli TaxID=3027921 RepID=A0ABT5SFR3_9MICO|nr:DUF305 domain-containing protein [Microbacterium thalli]MDD7961644.1 DUF305 domain-containing protein [Microbacterium thalli]MDN8549026.1 DUF305 domain-containing protein [Microbacterium thalli]
MTDRSPAGLRWWGVLLIVLAVAGAAFAVGRFTAFGTSAPVPGESSPEAGFARDMQVHHTQAIEMAMTIYRKTDDEGIRTLSFDIATAQSGQRGEFYDWLVRWGLPQRSSAPLMQWMQSAPEHAHGTAAQPLSDDELTAEMGMATPAQLAELDAATGTAADCLFLELMIRHHEGAVPMAEALVDLGSDPRAVQVAGGIVQTQSAEIDLMRSIQTRLGCGG